MCACVSARADEPRPLAFADVTLITSYGDRHLAHRTVIVRGDRIVSITSVRSARVPSNAIILNRPGQILAPGLADMHVHIFNADDGALFLANGVTTVRNMNGRADTNALAQRINAGQTPGPYIYSSGPSSMRRRKVGASSRARPLKSRRSSLMKRTAVTPA